MHNILMINSPYPKDHDRFFIISCLSILPILFARLVTLSTSTYLFLTRLNNFTLSHYGSNSCLPTLKPNLTTSVPRLTKGSLLGITMLSFHQLYTVHRTGAPPDKLYQKK